MNSKKKKKNINKKNSLMLIIILAVFFGLAGGFAGSLFTRAYIFSNAYDIPFFGEINFSDSNYSGSNLIIRDARKVVVEQDTKVIETINSVENSLVGIFKKVEVSTTTPEQTEFNLENYYKLNQATGQGLIITSDGWIINSAFIENANSDKVLNDYVVITKDKKIYKIDKFIEDPITSFSFIHVQDANNFSVKYFVDKGEVENGQMVVAVGWQEENYLTSIIGYEDNSILLKFTDIFSDELILADDLGDSFKGAAIFDLAGNVVGLVNREGKVEPISHFKGAINSLLENEDIRRPSLGINYVDLFTLTAENIKYDEGALIHKNTSGIDIVKGSVAELAGLKENDIIVAVEATEIDKYNDLTYVIQGYSAGDKINIEYLRAGERKEVEVELKEVK